MKVTVESSNESNSSTASKIQNIFQRILIALMDPEKFKILWPKLKDFADFAESGKCVDGDLKKTTKILVVSDTAEPEEPVGFGEALGLAKSD